MDKRREAAAPIPTEIAPPNSRLGVRLKSATQELEAMVEQGIISSSEVGVAQGDICEIAAEGSLHGKAIFERYPAVIGNRNANDLRRIMIGIYLRNPELADAMAANAVAAGHGSKSGSLVGIFKFGLKPQQELEGQGQLIATGEQVFGSASLNRDCVSVATWGRDDLLNQYAKGESAIDVRSLEQDIRRLVESEGCVEESEANPRSSVGIAIRHLRETVEFLQKREKSEEERLQERLIRENFPVLYFISGEEIEESRIEPGVTEIEEEFGLRGGIGKEGIKIILVPQARIAEVEEIRGRYGLNVEVFPIEDFRDLDRQRYKKAFVRGEGEREELEAFWRNFPNN